MLLIVMFLLAWAAVAFGLITRDVASQLDITHWLVLEIAGGAVASVLAGVVSRRVAGSFRGPAFLAVCAFTVGLLEAAEILRHSVAGRVVAPTWLVLIAPFVAAAGVLVGALMPGRKLGAARFPWRTVPMTEVVRFTVPGVILVVAAVLGLFALPGIAAGTDSLIVASALSLDLTVVVPGLVFVLLVRAKRTPWIVIVPTLAFGYLVASAVIPKQDQAVLEVIRLLVVPGEFCVIVYLLWRARRAFSVTANNDGDFATRFRSAAREVLRSRIPADILTTEISILYYAFRWRRDRKLDPNAFTVHRRVCYFAVVIGLLIVIAVETVSIHVLLSRWSTSVAWIVTCLSIYAGVWLIGDYRAMSARPIRVTATHLLLRVGVRWECDIPIGSIDRVEQIGGLKAGTGSNALKASLLGQPNVRIQLNDPIEVVGMYGIRKRVREIVLTVDGAAEFCDFLGARPAATP